MAVLVLAQFIKPEKNLSDEKSHSFTTKYQVPAEVDKLISNACSNCHSNKTEYPWYANIQPVASWLAHHVDEGKHELNFSEFTKLPIAVQNHKFDEIIETVEKHEMPLPSYTYFGLHPEAKLSDAERSTLINWAKAQMDYLKTQYPADSLILKRRGPKPSDS